MDQIEKDKDKRLDTQLMQERLKGETFPQDWNAFLEEDIRGFFDELLNETGQKKSEIIQKANLSRTYGYQIMEGRRIGKRDYYILIALAMRLDLKTTQRMLAVVHYGVLHPLLKRDAAIIFAINHGYDILKTYELMSAAGIEPLSSGLEKE